MKLIVFDTPLAAKTWRKLPSEVQAPLRLKIEAFAAEEHAGVVKRLQGQDGIRLRAGDYRAIVVESPAGTVRIVAAGHRRDIYR